MLLLADGVHNLIGGMAVGAAIGALVGGLVGAALMATGVLVGPWALMGAGPIVQAIGGGVAGAATGTAYGVSLGLDYWDEVADLHTPALKEGAVWIGVHAEGREADAEAVLRDHGALHVVQVAG